MIFFAPLLHFIDFRALRSLEGAINSKAGVAPKKGAELLDIQVAQEILERTRPAVTTPNTGKSCTCNARTARAYH